MIYLIKKYNIIFIFNPKCACTTIKNIIKQLEGIKVKKYFDVHKMNFNNVKKNELLGKYKDFPIIFFKRNPYDRFVSGYTKVTNKLILKFKFIKNKTQKECNKLVKYGKINIDDFSDIIINTNPKNLDNHYLPQTYQLENIFSHKKIYLYDIDNLDEIEYFLYDNFGIKKKLNIHNKYNLKKTTLSNNLKKKIYEFYKNDFILLDYYENPIGIIEKYQNNTCSNKNSSSGLLSCFPNKLFYLIIILFLFIFLIYIKK